MKLLSLSLAFSALAAAQTPTKTAVMPNDFAPIESQYKAAVAPVPVATKIAWPTSIPQNCVTYAKDIMDDGLARCTLDNLSVFEVTFTDAPASWVACYCTDSEYTEAQMIAEMGRLPAGIRQYVRNFMGFRGPNSGTVTGEKDALFNGLGPFLYLHEVGHIVDDAFTHSKFSAAPAYANAIASDSCWITNYAKANGEAGWLWEPWTDIFTYLRVQRAIGWLGRDVSCTQNQFNTVAWQTDPTVNAGYNAAIRPPSPGYTVLRSSLTPW